MNPALQSIVDRLLAASTTRREILLDEIGAAIGTRAVSPSDIEAVLNSLEAAGRSVKAPQGGVGEEQLKAVLATTRAFVTKHGRRPNLTELSAESGLSQAEVRHALALVKVMQR